MTIGDPLSTANSSTVQNGERDEAQTRNLVTEVQPETDDGIQSLRAAPAPLSLDIDTVPTRDSSINAPQSSEHDQLLPNRYNQADVPEGSEYERLLALQMGDRAPTTDMVVSGLGEGDEAVNIDNVHLELGVDSWEDNGAGDAGYTDMDTVD